MVNILLSTYNGAAYIEEQLDSIWKQEYSDFRLYIRDDGSKDNTVTVVEKWLIDNDAQNKVELIVGDNKGFCRSFGELLCKANSGDYWFFCDQDDIWLPNKLVRAVEYLSKEKEEKPLVYHGSFQCVDDNQNVIREYVLKGENYSFRKSLTSSICYGFTMAINDKMRKLLIQSDFSKIQSHDWYVAMIATAFGKIIFDEEIVAKHRIHSKNNSPNSFMQKVKKGSEMLAGTSFYTNNIREFYKQYSPMLSLEQDNMLVKFLNYKYCFRDSVYKACYPQRWNTSWSVEFFLRILMLIGKI